MVDAVMINCAFAMLCPRQRRRINSWYFSPSISAWKHVCPDIHTNQKYISDLYIARTHQRTSGLLGVIQLSPGFPGLFLSIQSFFDLT